jgi:nitrogen regulatory protein P-II 2
MRMITAVVKPSRFDDVWDALTRIGVSGMTASEVRGFGRQRGQTEVYRGAEYQVAFLPKVKIEIAVPEDRTEMVVETIREHARTGKIGDGKIFVSELAQVLRIRTGELDGEAV